MRSRTLFAVAATIAIVACSAGSGNSPSSNASRADGSSGSGSGTTADSGLSGSSAGSSSSGSSGPTDDSGPGGGPGSTVSGSSGSSGLIDDSGSGGSSASTGSGSTGSSASADAGTNDSSNSGGSVSGGPPDSGPGGGPCDIYASGGAPCVAAHSTVRALYGGFSKNIYQVQRASDMTTKDIGVLTSGGFADSAAQNSFCTGTTCTISIIYDQSPRGNDLTPAPRGSAHYPLPDKPANATALSTTVGGHSVYGVLIAPGMGYRNDKTSGVATGDQPETLYMVTSSKNLVNACCFDYGNAETNNLPDGAGSMEAVYFGLGARQGVGSTGTGSGPWVEADLENGLWASSGRGGATNTSLGSAYVTAVVVGRSGTFALRGGDAQLGTLKTMYDGPRPPGYNPMKKQGAIILGIGGDNSNGGGGEFFEGVITSGTASAAIDDAVQANIVAAGYGR